MHRKSVENCHSIRINLVPPIIQVDKTVELSTSHHRYRIKRWNILFFLFFSSGKHQHFVYIDNSLRSQIRCEKNPFSSSSIYPEISIDFATRLIEFTIYDLVPSRDNFNEEQKRETVHKKSRKSRSFSRVADPQKKNKENNTKYKQFNRVVLLFARTEFTRKKFNVTFCEEIKFFDIHYFLNVYRSSIN